jgi:glycine/sarcosine N-methyltransferase
MKDTQNVFYSSISKHYHEIFPYNPVQLKFVEKNCGGLAGKRILDIGCATGELAFQLANAGAEVTGIDLNDDLLQQAESEKHHPRLTFQKGDMLKLAEDFKGQQFDAVLCFGNTLVHLPSAGHVKAMLDGVRQVLKSGGLFLLQILNYDYILSEPVTELPVIETENIKFIRKYSSDPDSQLIEFKTELHLKKDGKVISNKTPLLPLKSNELVDLLEESAFENNSLYSNFKEEEFGGKHLPLVIKADLSE